MKKFLRILLGGMLLIVGCGFFLYPNFREWRTQREVDQIIERFDDTYNETIKEKESAGKYNDSSDKSDTAHETLNENNISSTPQAENDDKMENIGSTIHEETESDAGSITETPGTEQSSEQGVTAGDEMTGTIENSTISDAQSVETARPYQNLYDEMVKYNQDLADNGQEIIDAWSYEQQPLDLNLVDRESPVIGYIEIPDMKIRLPLMLGASPENLEDGAAVLSETSLPIGGTDTNCVIAGHRGWEGSAYFQYVENMRHGSKVYVTNPWETLVYECVDIKVIYPDDVQSILIQPGKDMITLFTCHPYRLGGGPFRYLVFCERVDTQKRVSAKGSHVVNPRINDDEPVSAMTMEEIEGMKIEDINRYADAHAGFDYEDISIQRHEIDEDGRTETRVTVAPLSEKDKPVITSVIPEAELSSEAEGLDLLALEQTLRYFLPVTAILFSIFIIVYRHLKPKKSHKNKKNKNKSKRRTKI